jgi:opacity protein-like surface antigen
MRKLVVAAALLSTVMATPAFAADGSAYVGIDAGTVKADRLKLRYTTSAQSVDNGVVLRHKWGFDGDAVFGYDFGMFRIEGELGYKRSGLKNAALAPAALAGILQPTTNTYFSSDGHGTVWSGMANAFADFGLGSGITASIGAGAGLARAKYQAGLIPSNALNFSGEDRAFAWQGLAEVRVPVTGNIDLGWKYRHFETAKLNFGPFCVTTCTTALPYHLKGKYRSNSILASVHFNFASAAPPAPPPPAPPPPPPAPPATQTCPDGSVIPATDTCPTPPPPPPPPPPAPERG